MPTSTQSIHEIVAAHSSAAAVLERFDIDLCSRATESLERACAKLQLSVEQVLEKLADAEAGEAGALPPDPASLSASRLIRHIVRVHHQRVRQELPRLAEMAHKLAGKRAAELNEVEALLEELRTDMLSHIEKEEQVLFPFIVQMDEDLLGANSQARACFRSVAEPIFIMQREHESANRIVAEIHAFANGFEPPAWACATHLDLYIGLRAFEIDLKQHVHLENDVLFPRAIEMEAALVTRG